MIVSKLCFDTTGVLWVVTKGNGLYNLDTSLKIFTHISPKNTNSYYGTYIRQSEKFIFYHLSFTGKDKHITKSFSKIIKLLLHQITI